MATDKNGMANTGDVLTPSNKKTGKRAPKGSKLKSSDIVEILEDFYVKHNGEEIVIKAGSDPSEAPDVVNWDFLARRNTVKAKK